MKKEDVIEQEYKEKRGQNSISTDGKKSLLEDEEKENKIVLKVKPTKLGPVEHKLYKYIRKGKHNWNWHYWITWKNFKVFFNIIQIYQQFGQKGH